MAKRVKALLYFGMLATAGLTLGGLSALKMAGLLGKNAAANFATINVDGWRSDPSIGSTAANAYTRARVARHGLLALAKEEAIYFTRRTDNTGARLREECSYVLRSKGQDAYWWSITLYDADSKLPMNDDAHLSLDATTIGTRDEWTATISSTPPETGYWLSSRAAGQFDLTLRLYRPGKGVIDNPEETLRAPSIQRLDCQGAA